MNNLNNKRKIVSVDSRLRNNPGTSSGGNNPTGSSSTNFNINLNVAQFTNKFTKCSISQLEIPKSYYLIDTFDSTAFFIYDTTNPGGIIVPISVGNYTAIELATELETSLNIVSGDGYTITFYPSINKFRFVNATGVFNITTSSDYLDKYFGFDISDDGPPASADFYSLNCINLQRHDVVYLRSDMFKNNNDNIGSQIYVNSYTDGDVIRYTTSDLDGNSMTVVNAHNNAFSFSVLDYQGKVINLNGVDIRFTLVLWEA